MWNNAHYCRSTHSCSYKPISVFLELEACSVDPKITNVILTWIFCTVSRITVLGNLKPTSSIIREKDWNNNNNNFLWNNLELKIVLQDFWLWTASAGHLVCVFRPALGTTQPPVQWVPGVLSPGAKRGRGVMLTTHPHLVPRLRMSRSYTSSPPHVPRWRVAGQLYFTFQLVIDKYTNGTCVIVDVREAEH
jgi:hypothetical protein